MLKEQGSNCIKLFGRDDIGSLLGITNTSVSRTISTMIESCLITEISRNSYLVNEVAVRAAITSEY